MLKRKNLVRVRKGEYNKTIIHDYLLNPIASQTIGNDRAIGVVAMWMIESIRIKNGKGFPCLFCYLGLERNSITEDSIIDIQIEVYIAYKNWWTNNQNLPVEEIKKINPLDGIHL